MKKQKPDLATTAQREIALRAESDQALDRLHQGWTDERNQMVRDAARFGAADHAAKCKGTLPAEYEKRRASWLADEKATEQKYDDRQSDLRKRGHTLGDEFAGSARDESASLMDELRRGMDGAVADIHQKMGRNR